MDYELVTVIRPNNSIWNKQKERLKCENGKVISISPSPDFNRLKRLEGVDGVNIIDRITQRTSNAEDFMFFNEVPTVDYAAIHMNQDRTISVLNQGDEIAKVTLFPNTRRHVRDIRYLNSDKTIDFVQEFADDGSLYSNIYYHNNQVEEINFLNNEQMGIVNYFYYNDTINYVLVRNPVDLSVKSQFNNVHDFITQQVAELVTPEDTVSVSYMGMEMFALQKALSKNYLHLEEDPFDVNGQIKGNLMGILSDKIKYIHHVKMSPQYYESLIENAIPTDKVIVIDE